ncbi:MAG: SemiSWEET family sugar transporter [Saprospiraceae bacterium]
MNWIEITGYIAAFLTTAAYVPQAAKTIKTRSTHDLSLGTFLMIFAGTLLWFTYGLFIHNMPMILANGITAALAAIILYLKLTTKNH